MLSSAPTPLLLTTSAPSSPVPQPSHQPRMRSLVAASLAGAALVSAAVPADKVTNLPTFGAPLSDTYSGYLDAGKGKHLHYFFTASLNAPATDPLVLWCE